jgi:hypothetical protein
MTPKLTETEQEVAWKVYADCYGGARKGVFAAVEAVLAMRDDYARGRESGIREALEADVAGMSTEESIEFYKRCVRDHISGSLLAQRAITEWRERFLATHLARLLPAKEPTPHNYVSTACFHGRHDVCRKSCKFCQVACGCVCHQAKETTPERRVEAILMRHKFRQDACEYVAAEIVADLARAGKEQK